MTFRDAVLVIRIAAAIPYVWLRVRLFPLPRAVGGIDLSPGPSPKRGGVQDWNLAESRIGRFDSPPRSGEGLGERLSPDRILHLTDRILERRVAYLRPSCLLRSMVLFRFLREAGVPVRIHFGVRREGDSLQGHAWLSLDGRPYAEAADPTARFQTVYSFPSDE
jgi:hypothetical protein